jgi:hypothetical protein
MREVLSVKGSRQAHRVRPHIGCETGLVPGRRSRAEEEKATPFCAQRSRSLRGAKPEGISQFGEFQLANQPLLSALRMVLPSEGECNKIPMAAVGLARPYHQNGRHQGVRGGMYAPRMSELSKLSHQTNKGNRMIKLFRLAKSFRVAAIMLVTIGYVTGASFVYASPDAAQTPISKSSSLRLPTKPAQQNNTTKSCQSCSGSCKASADCALGCRCYYTTYPGTCGFPR